MVETIEDEVDTRTHDEGIRICCPNCKSTDVILRESPEGYFWVSFCNNCGYRGREGKGVGCVDKRPPTHMR